MPFRIGPAIACGCLAAYRAVWLSTAISGLRLREIGFLLLADAPIVAVLLLLGALEARLRPGRRHASRVAAAAMIGVYAVYLADVATVLMLNARLQLADVRMFGTEWWLAPGLVNPWTLAILALAGAAMLVKVRIAPSRARIVSALAVLLLVVPVVVPSTRIPSYLRKYTGSVLLLGQELWRSRPQPIARYSAGDFAAYGDEHSRRLEAPFARTRTDVVLVIVESLSAVDSARTSGLRDVLPDLDALSRHGMLFRNFLANFEASEGGIVSLLSGVPPLHFPTSSTNTFGEYAMQPGVVASFARAGYHTEFLTSVPLQFISMDRYARSASVGFRAAAGQHETERFRGAPRHAFQSPGDHVLYEEVLARLDSTPAGTGAPRLTSVITASSHTPYVDPLGKLDTEENVWGYVQRELRWLHDELARRGFFEHGILIITGDHRKMSPVTQAERDKYGESAKARIPLIVIGKGVPRDVVDDRWLQQADLLAMLDRVVQPGAALSPFALWVERYVFVFGIASNASNLQVFVPANGGREAFRLNLRGVDIDWLTRPGDASAIERTIHAQRAMQQAVRAAALSPARITIGRALTPSDMPGILVAHSSDANIARDPDDSSAGLATFIAPSLDFDDLLRRAGAGDRPFTLSIRAFLRVPTDGEYWFSMFADDEGCLSIDEETVLECHLGINEGTVQLTAGTHRFDLRYVYRANKRALDLKWLTPGAKAFVPLPADVLVVGK